MIPFNSLSTILKGVALICLLSTVQNGQSQAIINYSIPQGLPSNEVYDIYQDAMGFLWFATDNGVVRYDGNKMEILHVKDGLSDPVVFSFYEDDDKNIWFRTYSGKLCYFDSKEKKIIRYKFNDRISDIVKNGLVFSICLDKDKTLWLSTGVQEGQLIKIDKNGKVFIEKLELKSLTYQTINNRGLIGFSRTGVLNQAVINGRKFPLESNTKTVPNYVLCSIHIEKTLFLSFGADLFEYNDGKIKRILSGKYPIISLSKDKEDCLWIGYLNHGVDKIYKGTSKAEAFPFFSKKSITKVHEDREHGYWFSTLESGVYYLPNKNIDTLNYSNETKINSIHSAFEKVIIGDQKGNLYALDPVTKKSNLFFRAEAPVLTLFLDYEKKLWASTSNSTIIFTSLEDTPKIIKRQSKIDFTTDGLNHIWATGVASTLFDATGNRMEHYSIGANRAILSVDSLLILAGKIGIQIRNRKFSLILSPKELKNTKIRKIDQLNDTTVLLSSIGSGPILLNPYTGNSNWLVTSREFPADNIYAAVITDSLLWLGTEKGIFRINKKYLLSRKIPFQHLSRQSGLLADKIDFITKVKNDLWAFSENGISIIPISNNQFDNQNPIFYIKSLSINRNKKLKVTNGQRIELLHQENYIHLDVGFISFNNQNIKIRFKVSDNDEWSYTNNKSIEFFSLSPGNYNINLEFSANNIVWSKGIKNLEIYIKPPWWGIWYFQLVIALLLVSWITFFVFTRISLIKQKQIYLQSLTDHQQQLIQSEIESIEKERTRIAKDLHDGIGTTLTSVKMRVNQVLNQYNQTEANTIENRLQDILREVKNITYDLTPPTLMQFGLHEGLKNYIEKIATGTHTQIKLNIFGEELKDSKVNLFVFRIIQELVVNSLKHANAKNITIHLSTFNDLLNILYEDDGSGFLDTEVTRGHGLYNIESRIQSLNGKILFETSSKGVSYSIDIPLS